MYIIESLLSNKDSMKRFIALSPEQTIELQERLKSEKNIKIHRRLLFIQMKAANKKNTEIMPILQVSMETCRDWTGIFLSSWFLGLCTQYYTGRRPWVLEKNKEAIKKHIDDEIVPTLTHLKAWILKELSISVQESWLGEWCKKNSIVLTRSWRSSQGSSNHQTYKNIS